jgi:hypothetical protein
MVLEIIDTPDYTVAHPDDTADLDEPCHQCALAVRPDTGELVLLWLVGGMSWSVSRNQPDYKRHRKEIEPLEVQTTYKGRQNGKDSGIQA